MIFDWLATHDLNALVIIIVMLVVAIITGTLTTKIKMQEKIKADTEKELVIFRDSFGSSISPLLINYYSKITIIDNRYISSNNYLNLIYPKYLYNLHLIIYY